MLGLHKNKNATELLLWVLICLYIGIFGYISFLKYHCFSYGDFDLAVHSQTLWNILHGSIYSSILGIDFLGNHAHFILFLIAPIYLLFQSPLTLLFLQTIFLALAAYPIYLIAREELNKRLALTLVLAYLFYPALWYTNLYEFHPTVFATLFLSFMFYCFMKKYFKGFILFMSLSLLCQENIPLIIVPMGIYIIFTKREIRWATSLIVSGVIWFWVMVVKVIPYFNKDTVQFFTIYSCFGNSVSEIVWFVITHPLETARIIITSSNLSYVVSLFMQVSFFSFFSPQILIIFPVLMQHLLSKREWEHTIYRHYTAEMIPIIFISAIYGIKRFFEIPYIKRYLREGIFISIMLIAVVISNISLGPYVGLESIYKELKKDIWDYQKENFIDMVPDKAGIVATFEFLTRLSCRKNLYSFHHIVLGFHTLSDKPYQLPKEAEYALLDFNDKFTFNLFNPYFGTVDSAYMLGKSDANLRNFMQNGKWGVVDMIGSIVLLKKGYKSENILYQVLDMAPEIYNPLEAMVADEIELIGYNVCRIERLVKNQIKLSFFWRTLNGTKKDYGCFVDIVDRDGEIAYTFIKPICYRIYPPYVWQEGEVVKEDYILFVLDKAEDGYFFKMGIFDYKDSKFYRFASSVPDAVDDSGRINLKI